MIIGQFGEQGQLLFEIELIADNSDIYPVEVMLDTGFTTGWLALNTQDIEYLEWSLIKERQIMKTAKGDEHFDIYLGKVRLDGETFDIPVIASPELPETLLGLEWLKTRKLVVDFPYQVLSLG